MLPELGSENGEWVSWFLREADIVTDVVEANCNLRFLLSPVLATQLDHVVLHVDNFWKFLHGSGIEVVEEELLGVVPRVRAVNELRLDEPLHGRPGLVDAVLKGRAHGGGKT